MQTGRLHSRLSRKTLLAPDEKKFVSVNLHLIKKFGYYEVINSVEGDQIHAIKPEGLNDRFDHANRIGLPQNNQGNIPRGVFFRRGIRGKCFKILLGKFKKFEFHRRGGEGDLNLGKIKQMIIP